MSDKSLKVLALCSYPREAAATRFRIDQFVGPLAEHGIDVEISPFLDSEGFKSFYRDGDAFEKVLKGVAGLVNRIGDLANSGKYDLVFVQREAMFFGPEAFEWLFNKFKGLPLVLDLDDATYVRYKSPRFGRLGSSLKFFGKTDRLIDRAQTVVCGNRFIAEYVEERGGRAVVIPTVVDLDVFRPPEEQNDPPVIGWIGTHSTYPLLESVFPALTRLFSEYDFVLRIIGSGRDRVEVEGVRVENLLWSLEREVEDFRSLDIGLYPIKVSSSANEEWLKGKSGFKAVQYMAVGVPFVMSPVGVCRELGVPGKTHFNAVSDEDWYNSLKILLSDPDRRKIMGLSAREFAEANFAVAQQVEKLVAVLRDAAGERRR
ncbi:MAG TPA: glycosyltransferase family 4 protein [Aridibacter sp.]|nr:glycosyltransferase family 4 protein [Aridibacter sp.]